MITKEYITEQLWDIFDSLGLIEKNQDGGNVIISDEIDSVQMISIIVDFEERFMIEIPDEFLVPEFLSSFEHISSVIYELANNPEYRSPLIEKPEEFTVINAEAIEAPGHDI